MRAALLILMVPFLAFAQPDTLWTRTFDSGGDDYATEIVNTADGGFALASSAVGASVDFRLTRLSANGDSLWSRVYGTSRDDWCTAMASAPAGGWLMGGFTWPPFSLTSNLYLVRVGELGDTLWTRMMGNVLASEAVRAILPMADGSFLIAGDMDITQQGVMDCYLVHADANGDTLWTRTYPQPGRESAASLCALADGNLLLAGSQVPPDSQMMDFYFIKLTPAGDTLWTRRYGGVGNDMPAKLLPTPDGGAVFTGMTDSFDPNGDMYLGKISGAGDSLWVQLYGGPGEDHGHSMAAMPGGGFVVCGHSTSFEDPSGDGYLLRTDDDGNLEWSYVYGLPGVFENLETVETTPDGGVIIAGNRGEATSDLILVRLDHEQSAANPPALPRGLALLPNYPNPFNAVTSIAFRLVRAAPVTLGVYNLSGQRVATLIEQTLAAGEHSVNFDASGLASGIYVYRLEAGELGQQKKMVLIK